MSAVLMEDDLPTPNTAIMPDREKTVVAAALAALGHDWPPGISKILGDPAYFLIDPFLCNLAMTLNSVHGTVPEEFGPADFARRFPHHRALAYGLSSSELPLSVAEMEAAPIIEAASGREVRMQLQQVMEKLAEHPERAHAITALAAKALQSASDKSNPRPGLSRRTADELRAMPDDPSDTILGDRLLTRGGKLVIAGAGGTGKSRLGTQLAACAITGQDFLAFRTNGHNLKWLILQGENDNTRLKHDLNGLHTWLGPLWEKFNQQVVFHTLETEMDAWLSVEDDQAQSNIRRLLDQERPDVVILDALYTFGAGDLNKDVDMRATLTLLQSLIHRGNPKRAIVVIHHALTGKSGLAKMTGMDRASFGRNSKVLHQWTRGQINVAPLDPANNDLLGFSCGKASNGREFQPFAARLTENMVYELDASVDVNAEVAAINGDTQARITTDMVAELCSAGGLPKAELAKKVMDKTGVKKTMAYRMIDKAESEQKVKESKTTGLYSDVQL